MKQRIAEIGKATVRILVDGNPSRTGLSASGDGLGAACLHVVQAH